MQQADLDREYVEGFDPETTILNKGNFVVPGQGQQPDYCHTPYVGYLHGSGNSALEMIVTCKLWRCPSCYRLKVDSEVFKYATLLECFSKVTGDRPFRAVGSMSQDQAYNLTLKGLRDFRRNAKDRLKRCGVTAGFKLDHPFRIKKSVQNVIRDVMGENITSGGSWDFILDPASLDVINDFLDSDFKSWRDLVSFSPHIHYLLFPGTQMIRGDREIVLAKLQAHDGSYELDSVRDVVKNIRYLVTHSGILVNAGKSRFEPADVFGDLHNWKPEDYLTPDEIHEVQLSVLEILNENRTKPYAVNSDGELCYLSDEQDAESAEDQGFIHIKEFVAYDAVTAESIDAWIASIDDPENARYVSYLLDEYSRILKDDEIPQKKRRLFVEDLRDPPDSFKIRTLHT